MKIKVSNFFKKLVFGIKEPKTKKVDRAVSNQWTYVRYVWNNEKYNDFGIERLMRLFLVLVLFLFPGLYVRDLFGRPGLLSRKIGVELYVAFKVMLLVFFFKMNITDQQWVYYITLYILIETILYLASIIFLSDVFAEPIAYRRSLVLIFINYIEITLSYAIFYSYYNQHIPNFFNQRIDSDIEIIYFSFITSATIGYGDIFPIDDTGRYLVISQIIVFVIFVGLFLSFFASKVHELSYFNDERKSKWQRPTTTTGDETENIDNEP